MIWNQLPVQRTPLSNHVSASAPPESRENPACWSRLISSPATSAHSCPGRPQVILTPPRPHIVATQIRVTLTPDTSPPPVGNTATVSTISSLEVVMENYFYICHMWCFAARLRILDRPNNWCATGQFKHFRTAQGYRCSFQK